MLKVFLTTVFRFLILALGGFYIKFMDTSSATMVSNWIMSVETPEEGEEVKVDPITTILSGIENINLQLQVLSGLQADVTANKMMLEETAKPTTTIKASSIKVASGSKATTTDETEVKAPSKKVSPDETTSNTY